VGLLGDEDPAVRKGAEAALARMGDAAREALRAALDAPDPEVAGRARALYRPLAAKGLELSLRPAASDPFSLYVSCFLKNPEAVPLVAVRSHFYFQSRVLWSFEDPEGSPAWVREVWRHGCSDIHPFEDRDFIVIPPGETRNVGWIEVPHRSRPGGRGRVVAKYLFKRPDEIDPRYFPNARLRQLYLDAVEVDGILSPALELETPPPAARP